MLLKKSGSRTPRVEVEEMGPSLDLVLRRTHLASDDLMKAATKVPRVVKVSIKQVSQMDTIIRHTPPLGRHSCLACSIWISLVSLQLRSSILEICLKQTDRELCSQWYLPQRVHCCDNVLLCSVLHTTVQWVKMLGGLIFGIINNSWRKQFIVLFLYDKVSFHHKDPMILLLCAVQLCQDLCFFFLAQESEEYVIWCIWHQRRASAHATTRLWQATNQENERTQKTTGHYRNITTEKQS